MKRASLFAFFVVLFPFLCFGFSAEEIALKAEKKLQSFQSLQANFEQFLYSTSVSTPLDERGKFYFKKPDLMRWEYEEPEKKVWLYKDGNFLFYIPEDNQLIRSSQSKEKYESEILAILSGQKSLRDNYQIEFNPFPTDEPKAWQLKLTPKVEGEHSFILLEINEKSWLIQKAVFLDWAGNKTEFHFSQIKTDVRLSPKVFELKVPRDCEVIEEESTPKK
jgi:outer membrane lipoprotein carrier protein